MTWFANLTGFEETNDPDEVRRRIRVEGETLVSDVNGRKLVCGRLETPSLSELRERVRSDERSDRTMTVRELVADVRALHSDPSEAGAMFQVASQFNLLEMVSPTVTPEQGVGRYEGDPTQGPACAIAAGAGTIYRNYFASVNGRIGQSEDNQIDCLADLGAALGNDDDRLWQMRNGYALATRRGLAEITERLRDSSADERDGLRGHLRIGIQWNPQVTLDGSAHTVSQAYCSALPVAYSNHDADQWRDFAQLVLEAAYEATLCAAILNARENRNDRVFLTLLGGGAFGNETRWILEAIERALTIHRNRSLDVVIVSHGGSRPEVRRIIERFS